MSSHGFALTTAERVYPTSVVRGAPFVATALRTGKRPGCRQGVRSGESDVPVRAATVWASARQWPPSREVWAHEYDITELPQPRTRAALIGVVLDLERALVRRFLDCAPLLAKEYNWIR